MQLQHLQRDLCVPTAGAVRTGLYLGSVAALLALAGSPASAQDDPRPTLTVEWSIDIGSDTELSDPRAEGDEVFDPGDMYLWRGPALAGPTDGVRDDKFAYAPWMPLPEPGLLPLAPVCDPAFPLEEARFEFQDTDASDSTDEPVFQFVDPNEPLDQRIPFFPSMSIHFPKGLLLSYDDDMAKPYMDCDIPITVPSPALMTWGTTTGRDEIWAFDMVGPIPLSVGASLAASDEIGVHPNLAGNPTIADEDGEDDDVDALDMVRPVQDAEGLHRFWFFSADHEALGTYASPLAVADPGHIYWWDGFTLGTFIQGDVHLGLRPRTDIDAFEIIWIESEDGAVHLGVMFSVDDDDPTTVGVDESGGLDPAVVYGSYLDGTNFRLVDEPFRDDIDGLAAWCDAITGLPEFKPPCPADFDNNGVLNFLDLGLFLTAFNNADPAADLFPVGAPDGIFNFFDLGEFLNYFAAGCP